MSSTGSVPAGTRLGRYEIVSLLGRGGMGEVYAAHDANLGRRVALKILPRHRTSDPERVARFVREVRASSALNHPSIVAVHDAGAEGDVHFLAMELIDGESLSEWMRARRPLERRVELMAQVAEGLARAHDAGIVHRDLKPENIMVTRDGLAKIVDFGVAKLTEHSSPRPLTGATTPTSRVGTTAYMSPEQIEGGPVDRRTDVFAFGVVLYELLTGRNPFAAPQYADTIHNVVHLEPSLEAVPTPLRRIVARCLRKDAGLRYDSLRDAALDLREALGGAVHSRRHGRRWWVLLALVPLALAALWPLLRREKAPGPPAMKMTRLTHSGRVTSAAISPDGKYLVHAVREDGGSALYVKQIATGTLTRIVPPGSAYYFLVRVSPDGNYIYYVRSDHSEPNVAYIEQLPLLGGEARRIAADTEFWFSISPDGKEVVFRRYNVLDREHRLTIAAVDGSGERVILRRRLPESIAVPVWSPDGKSITFAAGDGKPGPDGEGLFRLTLATGEIARVPVPEFPGVDSYVWLPDGSGALLTAFDPEQPPQVWFVPAGETAARKITSDLTAYYGVTPTADSKSFSAVRDVTDSNIFTLTLGRDESLRPLTSGFGNLVGGAGVRWLGEDQVIFSSVTGGKNTFFALDTDGGTPRPLIPSMKMWNAVVSAEGSKIAFLSDKSGRREIWVAGADGSNPRQVTRVGNTSWPSFTPDGRSIVFMTTSESQFAWRVPVDGSSDPVQVTRVPTNQPRVSPDGTLLLCRMRTSGKDGPLWRTAVVPMEGNGAPRYFNVPRFGGPPLLQWRAGGRSFVFVDFEHGVANLWEQDLAGGEPRRLTNFTSGEIFAFDLAPDGKRLLLSRGESTSDAVLIRDFR